mmetsp:Transcript_10109/g.22381  ORF Transcript_10109/g.22381 Transcript_10109/m.22381 type:complete len:513 (-) Transcript_10109:5-1543(-)
MQTSWRLLTCVCAVLFEAWTLHVEVPVSLPNSDVRYWLHWETDYQTAADLVRHTSETAASYYEDAGFPPEKPQGLLFLIDQLGETPAIHGVGRLRIDIHPGPGLFVPWEDMPGRLHSLLAMLATDAALWVEELPFKEERHESSSVGIFVLQSPGRLAYRMLCWSLRVAVLRFGLPDSSLHVLVHSRENWRPEEWKDYLGEAAPMLRGLHWSKGPNRYPDFNLDAYNEKPQDTYYNKVFLMMALALRHNYRYIVSVDDDVFLPPNILVRLITSGAQAERENCGVVSPLLQNGVPSVELWAQKFLPEHDRKRLFQCFSESSVQYCDTFQSAYCTSTTDPALRRKAKEEIVGLEEVPNPWSAEAWYSSVRRSVKSDFMGLHPVRGNKTCMELAFWLSLPLLEEVWKKDVEDLPLLVDSAREFPYFCNNVYLVPSDLYHRVLQDPGLRLGGADEATLSRVLHRENKAICHLDGSFALHPAYSTNPNFVALETTAFSIVKSIANRILPLTRVERSGG